MSTSSDYIPIDRQTPAIRTYVALRREAADRKRRAREFDTPTRQQYMASLRELTGGRP